MDDDLQENLYYEVTLADQFTRCDLQAASLDSRRDTLVEQIAVMKPKLFSILDTLGNTPQAQ